jgi:hypothetical protein
LDLGHGAKSSGTYTLSSGLLDATNATEYIGDRNVGIFIQTGGTNSLAAGGNLVVGNQSTSTGAYLLSGGLLTVNGNAYIGGSSSAKGGLGSLTVGGNGKLNVAGKIKIWNSGTVTLNGGSSSATAGGLQIAPGGDLVMDGPPNRFLINYGAAASPNATIRQYLQNGYHHGKWNDGGTLPNPTVGAITSTTATLNSGYSLGYADGSDGVVAGLSGGQKEIKFTYAGDANLDGQVNLTDLTILASHFGSAGANWDQGDFTYDNTVNLTDLSILVLNFGDGVGSPLNLQQDLSLVESSNPAFALELRRLVPEPSSIGLLSLCGLALLKRRERIPAKN